MPTVAFTYLNPENGREASASAGITFSLENEATDYQTAPEFQLEATAMQHLPNGLALGLTGYTYRQLGDDTGAGADQMRALTNAKGLQARVSGLGPIVTWNTKVGDMPLSLKAKYIPEFEAKRRFESERCLLGHRQSNALKEEERDMSQWTLLAAALTLVAGAAQVQSVLSQAERTSASMEPVLVHPEQAAAAQAKLDALFAEAGRRPNIVWLVVDDMGYGDPGAYGGGAAIGAATPNMDRLAREGLRLTSAYSQPTCTPTRSVILTGRLPVQDGADPADPVGDRLTKNPWADEISLPKLLGEAGYATVISGKWHVGDQGGMRPHDAALTSSTASTRRRRRSASAWTSAVTRTSC